MNTLRRFTLVCAIGVMSLALVASPALAITNGSHDGNDHPNVGAVYIAGLPATAGFCSGSLLSATEFLTAGHCTAAFTAFGLPPEMIYVSFDEELQVSPELVIAADNPIAVTGWVTHPDYRGSSGGSIAAQTIANDVGVIHLAQAVDATPIELPEAGFLDTEAAQGGLLDQAFVNVGYGFNSLDRALWGPNVNWTWEHRRMASTSDFMALTPNHLQEQGGVCGGDSGGPIFFGGTSPNLAVATVVSADDRCGSLAVGQRLDTEAVLDFLADYR